MYNLQELNNGLTLLAAPLPGAKTTTVLVLVGTGSKYETKSLSGISHFLEHMFFKGTAKRPNTLAIAGELDKVGGEYNAFTSKEYTGYWVKVASAYRELAMDVVSDMLINSKIKQAEIDREKGVIVEELNMYLDNPLMYIEELFEQCLYGNTPAGRDTIGAKANILRFQRSDFIRYLKNQYGADNIIICLAGDIKGEAASLAAKYFASLKPGSLHDKKKVRQAQSRPRVKLRYKKTDQAHLALGVPAVQFGHKDEMVLKVLAMILGGSMSSRLFTELRERRGLAYYVKTHLETYTDSGYLVTQAGVPLDKINQALQVILAEYKKLTVISGKTLAADELDKAKQCLIGRTALQLESSDDLASWYGRQAILAMTQERTRFKQNEVLTPENYYKLIKSVKPEDIRRVAREIFVKDKLNLAVIGPYKDHNEFARILTDHE